MLSAWWRLIKFGFRLLYNELAFTYDAVSFVVSLGDWRCWQRSTLKHLDPSPGSGLVLEIAHGTGNLQIDLKAAGYRTIGYDLSPYMGRIAARKLRKRGISADLVRGMAQRLAFADQTFAAVVCTFPTHFIFQGETVREIHRVLRPGAMLVVVPSGQLRGGGLLRPILNFLYRITGQGDGQGALDLLFTPILRFFGEHGFEARLMVETCPRSSAIVIAARRTQEAG
jgi:ubiquinone/menaquinone biosynthesis C-methylase UbiE